MKNEEEGRREEGIDAEIGTLSNCTNNRGQERNLEI